MISPLTGSALAISLFDLATPRAPWAQGNAFSARHWIKKVHKELVIAQFDADGAEQMVLLQGEPTEIFEWLKVNYAVG